ncbi:nuclear transport factor 2 family protein [Streptomyces sp. NPDC049837]|uniref:nuclear transport factor 2 family protein n=1 Tax=Streptomyces sp. NPDC049837 TaxID=3155277 RepID=UPI003439A3B8
MSNPNIELIRRFWAGYATGDLDGLRDSVLAPEAVWHVPGNHPLAGSHRGAEGITTYLEGLATGDFIADVWYAGADESHVVEVHHCVSHRGDGTDIDMDWVLVFRIEDGRIAEIRHFPADQSAVDEFFNVLVGNG